MISVSGLGSQGRFKNSYRLQNDSPVKQAIIDAFTDYRGFPFRLDDNLLATPADTPGDTSGHRIEEIVTTTLESTADGNSRQLHRLQNDLELRRILTFAIRWLHKAVARRRLAGLSTRRFVLLRELANAPTFFYIKDKAEIVAHVGLGPDWNEIPTIYLSLSIFESAESATKHTQEQLFEDLCNLLAVESRAIETGYSHIDSFPAAVTTSVDNLVEFVVDFWFQERTKSSRKLRPAHELPAFDTKKRQQYLSYLNARQAYDPLHFFAGLNQRAVTALGIWADRYWLEGDRDSLHEVVRLLVAASGHDVHSVRDAANIQLERIFAPKENTAPLAGRFINTPVGKSVEIEFKGIPASYIAEPTSLRCRLYSEKPDTELGPAIQNDTKFIDLPVKSVGGRVYCRFIPQQIGHYDFILYDISEKDSWVAAESVSGRLNVMPDLSGEVFFEIFTDIHGHTGHYWQSHQNQPGLVYNEDGEIIRLGTFADVAAHLPDLKKRFSITGIYLLGVQTRGRDRSYWAPEASSPSPFSPMSLTEIEPSLGGEKEFRELVAKAHQLDIKIVVDIIPHLNQFSHHLPDSATVYCYDHDGNLVSRSATDGKYGSWDDGRLLNYRQFEIWQWITGEVCKLIEDFDIDGIRFDSAHAVPVMMKKHNYPGVNGKERSLAELVEGNIITNERQNDHMQTTGYYDSACREKISVPFHYYFMLNIHRALRKTGKKFFINIAECFWGHERYLVRTGIVPYNSSLFKVCENILHKKGDVREIYHLYDNYFPSSLAEGSVLLGILGNHDERRAVNTFGAYGLQAVVALTVFMHKIVLDMEGNPEGEGWKVYVDNIYVNWTDFARQAIRGVEPFYRKWYKFHSEHGSIGRMIWTRNNMVAAAMLSNPDGESDWVGIFNFSEELQEVVLQFDRPDLDLDDSTLYEIEDIIYSPVTGRNSFYTGRELRHSLIRTRISDTDRVKVLTLLKLPDLKDVKTYHNFLKDSFSRLEQLDDETAVADNFFFSELIKQTNDYDQLYRFLKDHFIVLFENTELKIRNIALKRAFFYLEHLHKVPKGWVHETIGQLKEESDIFIQEIGAGLAHNFAIGSVVFLSAEADPFSKSGGLANVVLELPREMARQKEEVYVITPLYYGGTEAQQNKQNKARELANVEYTGQNVEFYIQGHHYSVGIHRGLYEGIHYILFEHHTLFPALYGGFTGEEKLRSRVAFARASLEVTIQLKLNPRFIFTNDAFCGLFNGILRADPRYADHPDFRNSTLFHLIHNGGWPYFDSYHRYDGGHDIYAGLDVANWHYLSFCDPSDDEKINCMATGIRFADYSITVSPSYARQLKYAGDGLEKIIGNIKGISNAISSDFAIKLEKRFADMNLYDRFYPELMERLPDFPQAQHQIQNLYPEILTGRPSIAAAEPVRRQKLELILNKLFIQMDRNLLLDTEVVLFCMIHRICEQKGYQIVLEASEGIFKELGFQAIFGGAVSKGDKRGEDMAHGLYKLSEFYNQQVSASFGYQDICVPLFSCDLFLMPSMSEPGGISQLEAFACGMPVLARATGGLKDTVYPLVVDSGGKVTGNGFLFSDYTSASLLDAMRRAHDFFTGASDEQRYAAKENAKQSVSFWDKPAGEYIKYMYRVKELLKHN